MRIAPQSSTKFSPFRLLYGREPCVPSELPELPLGMTATHPLPTVEKLNDYVEGTTAQRKQTEEKLMQKAFLNKYMYHIAIQIKLREFQEFSESREKSSQNQSQRNNSSTLGEQQTIIVQDRNSASSTQYSRLPKFSLPTFNGNILEWQAFWDSFSSAVHSNQNLTDVQKFNYLRSQLEDEAARKIDGFALTNANYSNAVELLHEQYGQKHKIVHAYIQSLLHLPSPSNTLPSLRGYYDKLET
ncbi:uncharacterized protein LOC123526607 [Mercenaria mercenaria]|uniref:uncharacterized protein LOC123526607 n=1 Tax=Mercenaria mercenaria TaxID=6596 RepID=UPI00234F57FE|nr:uncharacterized protein LOC123526607 [Mercenaria mercenaria]